MLFVLLMACANRNGEFPETPEEATPQEQAQTAPSTRVAMARLESRSGTTTAGTVTFTETVMPERSELRVAVDLEGATPGAHAVRIHEVGDCTATDAASAGGLFRPMSSGPMPGSTPPGAATPNSATPGTPATPNTTTPITPAAPEGGTATPSTGMPSAETAPTSGPMTGDIDVTVGADGIGRVEQTLSGLTLGEGPTSISGRSVVVYERGAGASGATGDLGRRIACGVVTTSVARAR